MHKVVQADKRGQIVIPKAVRKQLNLEDGSAFWIYVHNDTVVLEPIKKPKLRG